MVYRIILKSDGQHTLHQTETCSDYQTHSPNDLIQKIQAAGISGLGGAGFPTAVKLNPPNSQTINTLIINGTECEPYITADDTLMRHYAEDIIRGTEILAYILGQPKRIIIGIEDNKPEAAKAMQAAWHKRLQEHRQSHSEYSAIDIVIFPTKYPSGGEKQLIQILTGQEVPSGKIPASLGVVVQNVGTTMAVYRAICYGEALTWRITTVVGKALNQQRNVRTLLGTPIQHLLDEHGFQHDQCPRLIMGGPMMGFTLQDAQAPVVKTTNCIIAPSHEEMPPPPLAQPVFVVGFVPKLVQQHYCRNNFIGMHKLKITNVYKITTYLIALNAVLVRMLCPSAIPLVQYYRSSKRPYKTAGKRENQIGPCP